MPGIDFSNDPLLQGRLFSYLDTQLSRLGRRTSTSIPINAPKCPFANLQRDGHMQMTHAQGPRGLRAQLAQAEDSPRERGSGRLRLRGRSETGDKGRIRAETFADHYSQARMFYASQSQPEQAHLASALVFELSKVAHLHVREAMVGHLRHIDEEPRKARRRRPRHGRSCQRRPPQPRR